MSQQPENPKDYGDPAPDLTADEPGSVGDRMPPISADLEWAQDGHAPRPGEEAEAGVARVSDRVGAEGPPPAANQGKREPMPASPSQSGPRSEGPPAQLPPEATRSSGAAPLTGGDPGPGTTTPPDLASGGAGPAPAMAGAAPGTGGESQGTARPAIAVPGKPDGEVDTRV